MRQNAGFGWGVGFWHIVDPLKRVPAPPKSQEAGMLQRAGAMGARGQFFFSREARMWTSWANKNRTMLVLTRLPPIETQNQGSPEELGAWLAKETVNINAQKRPAAKKSQATSPAFGTKNNLVPTTGLEPVRCYPLEPESSASANSATWAQ